MLLQFDSTESLELLNHARTWVEQLNKKYPDRDYKATVSDINGRAVFIPRFLRALPLPPLSTPNEDASAAAAVLAAGGPSAGTGTDNQIQCVGLSILNKTELLLLCIIFSNVWLVLFH